MSSCTKKDIKKSPGKEKVSFTTYVAYDLEKVEHEFFDKSTTEFDYVWITIYEEKGQKKYKLQASEDKSVLTELGSINFDGLDFEMKADDESGTDISGHIEKETKELILSIGDGERTEEIHFKLKMPSDKEKKSHCG